MHRMLPAPIVLVGAVAIGPASVLGTGDGPNRGDPGWRIGLPREPTASLTVLRSSQFLTGRQVSPIVAAAVRQLSVANEANPIGTAN